MTTDTPAPTGSIFRTCLLNVEGLLAATVAVIWMLAFSGAVNAHPFSEELPMLAVAVWIIYGLDRAYDTFINGGPSVRREAGSVAMLLTAAAIALGFYAARHLPLPVLQMALRVGLIVLCRFAIVYLIRLPWAGATGVAILCVLLTLGVMQGTVRGPGPLSMETLVQTLWPQLWRGAMAGTFLTMIWLALNNHNAATPWRLPQKALDGWLFALGTVVVPYGHVMDSFPEALPNQFLTGAPVLLFGCVVMLNSLILSIRVPRQGTENYFLRRAVPWLCLVGAAGAMSERTITFLPMARPLFVALAGTCLALAVVHFLIPRMRRLPALLVTDGVVIAGGVAALMMIGAAQSKEEATRGKDGASQMRSIDTGGDMSQARVTHAQPASSLL